MVERTPRATDTDGLLLGDLAPGARVGEYVIERAYATRGTGHVYEALHRLLPRRVTIKVMPAPQPGSREVAFELLREACIVEALDHPGIPRLYECGLLPDRRPWIATELVEGTSLATLRDRDALTLREAATIVRDVAEILAHAHTRGLSHRNVTPGVIVFPAQARRFAVVLADWSGARARDSRTPVPLLSAARTTRYVAPEYARGGAIDSRADIYALGVIARELLRHADPDDRPPVFVALVNAMTAADPSARPTAGNVRAHAAWLADEIENETDPELAIPAAIAEERTNVIVRGAVTSEASPAVTGEIHHDG